MSCQQIQEEDFRRKEHFNKYAPTRTPKWLPFASEKIQTEGINQLKQKLRREKDCLAQTCLLSYDRHHNLRNSGHSQSLTLA